MFATASALGQEETASRADLALDPKLRAEALEADTVVLRERIAELTSRVERMRADLATTAPTRGRAEASEMEDAQRSAPDANALVLIALGTFAALLGVVIMGQRRWSERRTSARRLARLPSNRLATTTQLAQAPLAKFGAESNSRSEPTANAAENGIEESPARGPRSMLQEHAEAVLAYVDADLIEELRVRVAFAAAAKEASNTPIPPDPTPQQG